MMSHFTMHSEESLFLVRSTEQVYNGRCGVCSSGACSGWSRTSLKQSPAPAIDGDCSFMCEQTMRSEKEPTPSLCNWPIKLPIHYLVLHRQGHRHFMKVTNTMAMAPEGRMQRLLSLCCEQGPQGALVVSHNFTVGAWPGAPHVCS